ncbi:MAG: hypothetical protein IJT44_05690 [Clostridia bacterium]|nr:hypothetical protein [Clostridia bacterium]
MKTTISELGYAIVLGCAHFNALGVIRSLGEAGIPSVFICTSAWSNASYSKYTLRAYQASDAPSVRDAVLDAVKRFGGKPSVFPTADDQLPMLEEIRAEICDQVVLPQLGAPMRHVLRKDVMCETARRAGFRVPQTKLLDDTSAASIRAAASEIGFPCILKPNSGTEGAKADIRVLHSEADLSDALTAFSHYRSVLMQEFVDSANSMMVEYCGCKTPGRKVCVFGELRKTREFPTNRGSTSFAKIVPQLTYLDPDVLDAFLEEVGFSGVFDLELKVTNGAAYFLEINYRNGAPSYGFTKAGFNVPATWHLLENGREAAPVCIRETLVHCEGIDLSNVFAHNISMAQWLRDFRAADAHMVVNRRDMRPLFSSVRLIKPFIEAKLYSRKG